MKRLWQFSHVVPLVFLFSVQKFKQYREFLKFWAKSKFALFTMVHESSRRQFVCFALVQQDLPTIQNPDLASIGFPFFSVFLNSCSWFFRYLMYCIWFIIFYFSMGDTLKRTANEIDHQLYERYWRLKTSIFLSSSLKSPINCSC